ncbi:hypothetical protein, partial [Salmonella enterica]
MLNFFQEKSVIAGALITTILEPTISVLNEIEL